MLKSISVLVKWLEAQRRKIMKLEYHHEIDAEIAPTYIIELDFCLLVFVYRELAYHVKRSYKSI